MIQRTDFKFDDEGCRCFTFYLWQGKILLIQALAQQNADEANGVLNDEDKNKKAPKIVEALNVFTTE